MNRKPTLAIIFLSFLIIISLKLSAQETEIKHLSGTGYQHTKTWDFYCTEGRQSGEWTTIEVPSCWELEGFGTYNYGRGYEKASETGKYRYEFEVDRSWKKKRVFIVFDGVMTDATARVNGEQVGEKHQGSFYRFRYDITDHLKFNKRNLLEVDVDKMSSNESVNKAERNSDYWIFGGIFRPVFLEAYPETFVRHIAIDAQANGSFNLKAEVENAKDEYTLTAQIYDLEGNQIGDDFTSVVYAEAESIALSSLVQDPELWSAETPNLYRVRVILKDNRGNVVHEVSERFGFRTVEVREGDGVYVNGQKIILKGTNRHCFFPPSGRTLNDSLNLVDVKLLKSMNMNAVRMSHYPPDKNFLHVCDSLGLYVLDELAGWQDAYDTEVGTKLVRELVRRDVNHPSIIFWDNGNEGGWNTELDDEFAKHDPQNRQVLHPWTLFRGINTEHYESYESVDSILSMGNIHFPTEFLHGLYDGGHGAGLEDYWELLMSYKVGAGGFTWVFADEGVVRTDLGGVLDVNGNQAPDGILGPYREKEASYYTIKEIWSPVQLVMDDITESFDGAIGVENHYSFINLYQCRFEWALVDFPDIASSSTENQINHSDVLRGPAVAPGDEGMINIDLPENWRDSDALQIKVKDHHGQILYTWRWRIDQEMDIASVVGSAQGNLTVQEGNNMVFVRAGNLHYTFDQQNGILKEVRKDDKLISLKNGPILYNGYSTVIGMEVIKHDGKVAIKFACEGNMDYIHWTVHASGALQLDYQYVLSGEHYNVGVSFDYPEYKVHDVRWNGDGPFRVYKNRLKGVEPGVYQKDFNTTITGYEHWQYPEFKGFHANTYWAVLNTEEGKINVMMEDKGMFLRLFTPEQSDVPRNTEISYPNGDISFMDGIPASGTKFKPARVLGPQSEPYQLDNHQFKHTVYFSFE